MEHEPRAEGLNVSPNGSAVLAGPTRTITPSQALNALKGWLPTVAPLSWGVGLVVTAGLIACFREPIARMVEDWRGYVDYHHCAFVPLISAWYCWRRLHNLATVERTPSAWGLVPLGMGLAMRWVGQIIDVQAMNYAALILVVFGLAWSYLGTQMIRELRFPIGFLIFMIPIPFPILAGAGFPLQTASTKGVYWICKFLGLPIIRDGFSLMVHDFRAVVVEKCSGMHSLFALSMIGTLVAAEIRMDLWKKCLMVLLILPIVLVANTFRILLTILTATLFGDAVAEGLFHWASGIILFGVSLVLLFSVRNLLTTGRVPRDAPAATPQSVEDPAIPPADWPPPPAEDLW